MRISDWSSDVCSSDLDGIVDIGCGAEHDGRCGFFGRRVDDLMVLAALAVDPPAADVILLEMLFGAHRLSPIGVKCVSLCYLSTGADESSAVGREIIAYRRQGATSGSRRA